MRTVSVIIPTYNYGRFIGGAIESVLAQTYPLTDIIIVDDGSTDETESVVRRFGDKVRYVNQQNAGVCAARNKGVEISSGDLIAFLDADDTWLPEKTGKQVAKFSEDPEIGLVHCGMYEFDDDNREEMTLHLDGKEGWVANELMLFEQAIVYVNGSMWIVRRDVFEAVGGFDIRLKNGEDWEFCLRVARKYKVGFVAEPLVNYRSHDRSATRNIAEMERSALLAWATVFDSNDAEIRKRRRRSYGNLHKALAGSYLKMGEYVGFARNLIKSVWFRPSFLQYYLRLPLSRKKPDDKGHL